jgi:hypothetical protein
MRKICNKKIVIRVDLFIITLLAECEGPLGAKLLCMDLS